MRNEKLQFLEFRISYRMAQGSDGPSDGKCDAIVYKQSNTSQDTQEKRPTKCSPMYINPRRRFQAACDCNKTGTQKCSLAAENRHGGRR
ncbi:jg5862 [Pararge aegeria aegeria]|uniref:Jg5862 protein n=1 Tax=Pararge aegeria aegeria TaxID=348720 RepID=A0A8S4SGQ6_9NEOP|nr:jg5862 [Pararge aegeria aegeria]